VHAYSDSCRPEISVASSCGAIAMSMRIGSGWGRTSSEFILSADTVPPS